MIMPSEDNPVTLHLSNGTYSPETGESFPIILPDYVSINGESQEFTIIDAQQTDRVITIPNSTMTCITDTTYATKAKHIAKCLALG